MALIITITVHQGHAQSVFELLISKLFSFRRACKLKFYCFNRSKDRHTEKMSRSIQLRNRKIGLISLGIIVAALTIVELTYNADTDQPVFLLLQFY